MTKHGDDILKEASTGEDGPIAEVFQQIEAMASTDAEAAGWGLAKLFGTVQDAASAAFHKTFGFLSTGARRGKGGKPSKSGEMWNALSALFNRYSDMLLRIARQLKATGFSLGLNIPIGFTMSLNFDFSGKS